jgi:hypothetical protein
LQRTGQCSGEKGLNCFCIISGKMKVGNMVTASR